MTNVYRADHLGTLVKPEALLKAPASALRAAQDAAIRDAIELQRKVLLTFACDGELRRAHADEPYVSSLEGIQRLGDAPNGNGAIRSPFAVSGTVTATRRLTEGDVAYLKAHTKASLKVCLRSPSSLAVRYFNPGVTTPFYRTVQELAVALSGIMQSEIDALIGEGVDYIQLDSPAYDAVYEGAGLAQLALPELDSPDAFESLLAVDAAMIKAVTNPRAATLAMHMGRVPGVETDSDRYERMTAKVLELLPVQRVLLEYAAPQAHDFTALRALPAGAMAVLGLVQSNGQPDEVGSLIERIEQAAQCTPEENLALSPRQGFHNRPGVPAAADMERQLRTLDRTSEAVQQFWGFST
jgi:5-methyltetrahydropteroyltriglutamate--homocysteine methyltransferase